MKFSQLTAFEKHLEGAVSLHFADIYTILSKEEFSRKQAVDKLASFVLQNEGISPFNFQIFDAEKCQIEQILQELQGLAFFAKKRLIVIQNADSLNKAATTKLEPYFSSPNRTICLAIVASTLNRATTFYKKAEKAGIVLDIAEEKPWEKEKSISEWLFREVEKHRKKISLSTCQQLVKQLGTNQTLLQTELQKLLCYIGDRTTIEDKDIAAISTSLTIENVWQLGEAIFRKDASSALRTCKGMLDDGTAAIALLRQIRSQFQTEYQVCSILASGGGPAEISKEFPYMKGTILDRHVKQSQNYGMPNFKKGLLAIDESELHAKNSNLDPEFIIEMLIIKLVT